MLCAFIKYTLHISIRLLCVIRMKLYKVLKNKMLLLIFLMKFFVFHLWL